MKLVAFLGRFLELRARAFIYALFALVGWIIGVITTYNLALALLAAKS